MKRSTRRLLVEELDKISSELILDYHDESKFSSWEEYTLVKQKIIRWSIINAHTYIDSLLTLLLTKIIFKRKTNNLKKIMDSNTVIKYTNLYLTREIDFQKKIIGLDKICWLNKVIYKKLLDINEIRNILAHSYNFDISRKHYGNKVLEYNNNDIMSYDGISLFMSDINDIISYLENI